MSIQGLYQLKAEFRISITFSSPFMEEYSAYQIFEPVDCWRLCLHNFHIMLRIACEVPFHPIIFDIIPREPKAKRRHPQMTIGSRSLVVIMKIVCMQISDFV
jgi:hypothetical protein